jgi:hypothetical protein
MENTLKSISVESPKQIPQTIVKPVKSEEETENLRCRKILIACFLIVIVGSSLMNIFFPI